MLRVFLSKSQHLSNMGSKSYPPTTTRHNLVTHAQRLWNEWEIQCLVLLSMSLQVFLLFSAVFRKRSTSRVLSVLIWLAYLSADSVAVFVLGRLTLLVGGDDPSHQLVLFWAPFLLLHLGGQETIAAFSMEDCALWKRHLLTLSTQVTLAVYVVGKQWRGDRRLVVPTALVFVSGTAKYAERIWVLKRAGSRSSVDGSNSSLGFDVSSAETVFSIYSTPYYRKLGSMISDLDKQEKNLERVVELATDGFGLCLDFLMDRAPPRPSYRYNLGQYVNAAGLTSDKSRLAAMAYKLAEIHLSLIYDFLYTKFGTLMGVFYRLTTFALTSTALALFVSSRVDHKGRSAVRYSGADVAVSYTLLVGAVTLEMSSILLWLLSSFSPYMTISSLLGDVPFRVWRRQQMKPGVRPRIKRYPRRPPTQPKVLRCAGTLLHNIVKHLRAERRVEWSRRLQQYNIIDGCIQQRRGRRLEKALHCLGIMRDCTPPVAISADLKKIVFYKMHQVRTSAGSAEDLDLTRFHGRWAQRWALEVQRHRQHILQPPSPETEIAHRDQQTALSSEIACTAEDQQPALSFEIEIDDQGAATSPSPPSESVAQQALQISDIQVLDFASSALLWHLVTDICLVADSEDTTCGGRFRRCSRELSNYVMHLIIRCRSILGRDGHHILVYYQQQLLMFLYDDNDVDRSGSIQKLQNIECVGSQSNMFRQAHHVSLELMKIEATADRWELIATVWVEMLCYIAHNCEAGFHAKQLSAGGEFASHVKVLLFILSFPF